MKEIQSQNSTVTACESEPITELRSYDVTKGAPPITVLGPELSFFDSEQEQDGDILCGGLFQQVE